MESPERPHYEIKRPEIPAGVVPNGSVAAVLAKDCEIAYDQAQLAMDAGQFSAAAYNYGNIEGFPGYPYLMLLALRVEYRNMATALASEMTREWIEFTSNDDDEGAKEKIAEIEKAFVKFKIQGLMRKAILDDAFYGTGQILINIKGADWKTPLIVDSRTVKKGSLEGFKNVDPIWVTPLMFNALEPQKSDFYVPDSWWVMGQHWSASRMIIIITRPVPDIYKPSFNFSGISLSQLVEPYVNNWLRTRQSVSDLINNFSIVILKTAMDQALAGGDGSNFFNRLQLFTLTRSNKGIMALDKEREELDQIAVPLGGLHELQAQAQEQMCSASREPSVVMTGISPSGFGNVAEGEMKVWYDWIRANQEAHLREPITRILRLIQLHMFGEIDDSIDFEFKPLEQMTEEQMSVIRVNDSTRAGNYIDRGVIDAQEERERLARDPESGYQGIDIDKEIPLPSEQEMSAPLGRGTGGGAADSAFVESDHPRDEEGRFTTVEGAATHLANNHPVGQSRWTAGPLKRETAGHAYSLLNPNDIRRRLSDLEAEREAERRRIRSEEAEEIDETSSELSEEDIREIKREEARQKEREAELDRQIEAYEDLVEKPSRRIEEELRASGLRFRRKGGDLSSQYFYIEDPTDEEKQYTLRVADHPQATYEVRGKTVKRGGMTSMGQHEVADVSVAPQENSERDAVDFIRKIKREG